MENFKLKDLQNLSYLGPFPFMVPTPRLLVLTEEISLYPLLWLVGS